MTPGAGSGWGFTLETVDMLPRYKVWEITSPRRLWTCVTRYWVWKNAHGRDWICDPKYSAWKRSPWGLKTCDLRYRIWEGVILENVDM